MSLELTSEPMPEDEAKLVEGTRACNWLHVLKDTEPLCLFDRLDSVEIIAGLTGNTYRNYLEIAFLRVSGAYRNRDRATAI